MRQGSDQGVVIVGQSRKCIYLVIDTGLLHIQVTEIINRFLVDQLSYGLVANLPFSCSQLPN
jgi:hypothetical protein